MDIKTEIHNLKKELVFLRVNKITKQKTENHKIKKIQHQISTMYHLNHKNKK